MTEVFVNLRRQSQFPSTLLVAAQAAPSLHNTQVDHDSVVHVLDLQEMADLLAFLGKAGAPRRRIPGNQAKTAFTEAEGFLELTADKAEIYGDAISFQGPLFGFRSITLVPIHDKD